MRLHTLYFKRASFLVISDVAVCSVHMSLVLPEQEMIEGVSSTDHQQSALAGRV